MKDAAVRLVKPQAFFASATSAEVLALLGLFFGGQG